MLKLFCKIAATTSFAAAAFATFLICPALRAQTTQADRQERWRFYSPDTPVSDDTRRVPVPSGPQGPTGTLVLRGGRIFDGTSAPAREGTLVIAGNKILKILAPGSTDWPEDAQVIDVHGETVIPGLIDLHTHLSYSNPRESPDVTGSMPEATLRGAERLRYYIESGITSVRDVASNGEVPFRLQSWVNQNRIVGPRIFAAGQFITGIGGHGDEGGLDNDPIHGAIREASGADGWRDAVRIQFNRGANVIKIGSHFSVAEVTAAVQEAHELGLKVTCDCETFYIKRAVEAGVDMIEHPLPRTDETIRLMAQKGTEADPTLIPYILIFDLSGGYYYTTSRRFTFSKDANFEVARRMKQAGIKMGIGTDLVTDWYRYLPGPYITEMKQFAKLGYTVPEVLSIATKTNAEMLDMGTKLGTLDPGKLADVTVIDGRPDENLDDIAKVDLVIRNGYITVKHGQIFVPRHLPVPMPQPCQHCGAPVP
ncbi:MAG: amidohydrolase family protein [Candidatus Acidiferrum sp.]|jgi:imidazolonepropionase-like amidohydrolase